MTRVAGSPAACLTSVEMIPDVETLGTSPLLVSGELCGLSHEAIGPAGFALRRGPAEFEIGSHREPAYPDVDVLR